MSSRIRRPSACEKIEIHSDGTALLGCRNVDGQPIMSCLEAPDYRDSAMPTAEQLCVRALAEHMPHMRDEYKEPYVRVCHNLDETLADPFKATTDKNLEQRFESMARELEAMVSNPDLSKEDNGRYLYHIDARVLHAFLPAFLHRAKYGVDEAMPTEIIHATYQEVAAILDDFSELYENVAVQVALRRTEVEILALLLRTGNPEYFAYPTVFREDASETREHNHDAYKLNNGKKIRIQITNTDYKLPNGRSKSESYGQETLVAIHQQIVNLDYRDGETHITPLNTEPVEIQHEHDVAEEPYAEFDDAPRYVVWGAYSADTDEREFEDSHYVQEFSSGKRDGLTAAIVKEAKGKRLSLTEKNNLNGASHYLIALIREKQETL